VRGWRATRVAVIAMAGCVAAVARDAAPPASAAPIVAAYLDAVGGHDRLKAVRSMRLTGTLVVGRGPAAAFVLEIQRPSSMRMEITVPEGVAVTAFDGTEGWAMAPAAAPRAEVIPAEQLREARQQADIDGPLVDSAAKGVTVELVGTRRVRGRKAYDLKLTRAGGEVMHVFLDATTYLPVQSTARRFVRGTEVKAEIRFDDYREVAGLKLAHAFETRIAGAPAVQRMLVESIEINPEIDARRFAMPPSTPP
jgi:hypothetical protein